MDAKTKPLTIGDVIPSNLKSDYSETVLSTTMSQAINIVRKGMPPPDNYTEEDLEQLHDIYEQYEDNQSGNSGGASSSGSAYWDKSPQENQAYWDKNQ